MTRERRVDGRRRWVGETDADHTELVKTDEESSNLRFDIKHKWGERMKNKIR